MAKTMPPIMKYFEAQQRNGGTLIVADPRRSSTAQWAKLHLSLRPGTDAALANGLVHVLIRESLIDRSYIESRTEGFDDVKRRAKTAMVLTSRGAEQHSNGVDNVLAFINVALAIGAVGRPFSGYGTITGQGNGQGGREHGQKADQLPGYRRIDDPRARRHVAAVWGIPERDLPGPGKSAYELIESAGEPGGVRALLVIGSNPLVSAPNATHVAGRFERLDFLAVADFFLSETANVADVVVPSAQWAEEDGTVTNLEGRVIRRRRALDPPEQTRTDIDLLCTLARALGKSASFSFQNERAVFDELRAATRGGVADYSGISYDRLDQGDGVFWPCPAEDHAGTPRLFEDTFPTSSGRARFHAIEHDGPAERPDERFPLYLTTGRVLAHYQSGTQTRRIASLIDAALEAIAEIHPQLAKRHGLADGAAVVVGTRRGSAPMSKRRLGVIGNGMAGARLVDDVLARGGADRFDVVMFGDEPCGNYNRILLSSVLSRSHKPDDIFINPMDWYAARGITLHAGKRVETIDLETKVVAAADGVSEHYDTLVIATGGSPVIPPFANLRDERGAFKQGVFVFRTLDDCERIMQCAATARRAAVIGGGLLGLEAARGLLNWGLETHVIHLMPHLMETQLDPGAADVLRRQFEQMGLRTHLATRTTAVLGNGHVAGLEFADGHPSGSRRRGLPIG